MKKTTLTLMALTLLPTVQAGDATRMEHVAKFCDTILHMQDYNEAINEINKKKKPGEISKEERMQEFEKYDYMLKDGPLPGSFPAVDATAEEAVRMGVVFGGESRPQDLERLAKIWNFGFQENLDKDHPEWAQEKRIQGLHEWAQEIMDGADADDSTVINILTCMACWSVYDKREHGQKRIKRNESPYATHYCMVEHKLGRYHLFKMLSNKEPINSDRVRYYLDYLRAYMAYGFRDADTWLQMVADVNADESLQAREEYPAMSYERRNSGVLSPEWKQDVEAEAAYMAHKPFTGKQAWHDWAHLFDFVRHQGMQGYSRHTGETLPRPFIELTKRLQALREKGTLPGKDSVEKLAKLATQEREAAGELADSYTTRCMLALAPGANVWKPLTEGTPLYLMPDVSAVYLPQWDDALFGAQTTVEEDIAAIDKLASAAKGDKLGALCVLILEDGDRHFPVTEERVDMHTKGYDAFSVFMEVESTENGMDIVVTNDGPRFSRHDKELQTQARALELALHRAVLKLARMESRSQMCVQGPVKNEELLQASRKLAEVLNKHGLWNLLFNQYQLRGVSPAVYYELAGEFRGDDELLYSLCDLPDATLAYHTAKTATKNGKPDSALVRRLLQDMLRIRFSGSENSVADEDITHTVLPICSKDEAKAAAKDLVEQTAAVSPELRATALQYLCYYGMEDEAEELLGDDWGKAMQSAFSYMGYKLICKALQPNEVKDPSLGGSTPGHKPDAKDLARAKAIWAHMEKDPSTYTYAAGRMAAAKIAEAEGRTEDAARLRKDGVILAGIRMQMGDYSYHPSWYVLLDEGLTGDCERIWTRLGYGHTKWLYTSLMSEAARKGQFEMAAHLADQLLLTACKTSIVGRNVANHRELALLRYKGDFYRALDLIVKGDKKGEKLLPDAMKALNPWMRAVVPDPRDVLVEKARNFGRGDATPDKGGAAAADIPARPGTHYLTAAEKAPAKVVRDFYTWHIMRAGKPVIEVEARIEDAGYSTADPSWSWLHIVTDDGQNLSLSLTQIAADDIDNIIDWHEKNGFMTCLPVPECTDKPFAGRPVGIGSEDFSAFKARVHNGVDLTKDGRFVMFYTSQGRVEKVYMASLAPETREQLEPLFQQEAGPTLGILRSWKEAKEFAQSTKREAVAYFIGKRGGWQDKYLEQNILSNPKAAQSLNSGFAIVLCYQDEQGNWDAVGQEVLEEIRAYSPDLVRAVYPGMGVTADRLPGHPLRFQKVKDLWPDFYKDPDSWKALSDALRKKDVATVERLIKAEPDMVSTHLQAGGSTPLTSAAVFYNDIPMVKKLLELGADPNTYENSAVHILADLAMREGRTEVIRVLLEAGADPNANTVMFGSGLTSVATRSRLDNMLVLLEFGLDPNHAVSKREKPLGVEVAGSKNDDDMIIKVLDEMIKRGLDVKKHGKAMRREAERANHAKVLQFLDQKGIK